MSDEARMSNLTKKDSSIMDVYIAAAKFEDTLAERPIEPFPDETVGITQKEIAELTEERAEMRDQLAGDNERQNELKDIALGLTKNPAYMEAERVFYDHDSTDRERMDATTIRVEHMNEAIKGKGLNHQEFEYLNMLLHNSAEKAAELNQEVEKRDPASLALGDLKSPEAVQGIAADVPRGQDQIQIG